MQHAYIEPYKGPARPSVISRYPHFINVIALFLIIISQYPDALCQYPNILYLSNNIPYPHFSFQHPPFLSDPNILICSCGALIYRRVCEYVEPYLGSAHKVQYLLRKETFDYLVPDPPSPLERKHLRISVDTDLIFVFK